MRFTFNAFIVSTVSLLSLTIPVLGGGVPGPVITTPFAGQSLTALHPVPVTWCVVKRENPSAVFHHKLLTADITAGTRNSSTSPA